jgi:signal transduction histidine kinase
VEDNGHGFDINEVLSSYERRGSLGLISLQERTDMIGGVLKILSKPGEGTRVRVIIPLDAAAAERIQRGLLSLGN